MFERMLTENKSTIDAYCQHPFNQQLYDGSLPRETFTWFLQQDAIYLRTYAKVMQIISERLEPEDIELAAIFRRFQIETVQAELDINKAYLKKPSTPFFSHSGKVAPVIASYIQHLTTMANSGTIVEAITACYPCFLLYFKLGEQNKGLYPKNDYSDWTVFYSDPTFIQSTELITAALKKHTDNITCPILQQRIIDTFSTSAKFEVEFCDAAYATITPAHTPGWTCAIL